MPAAPIAIFYEHPDWFKPLFAELDRRGIRYVPIHLPGHSFDPGVDTVDVSLVVNRVSAYPSAASDPQVVLYVKQYLAWLERIGVPVLNGWYSYEVGTSKALQMTIFKQLGLKAPASRVIHHLGQAVEAASSLRFPVLIKPNVGGSGAGITLFNTPEALATAVAAGSVDLGIDRVALVQEYLKPADDCIYRVEIMNDAFLYAIRLPIVGESFNYCPADGCNIDRFDHCPLGAHHRDGAGENDLGITAYDPDPAVVEQVRQAVKAAGADIGGVEYLVNAADGQPYFYDINPLSNFVANALQVVGFDPVSRFVDYIVQRAGCG
jgi:glutathione synthase/RimK-type ligase-like ATP-grasp enzyme